jgi:3-oxoacyl-[acyl-carrier protein] reductase
VNDPQPQTSLLGKHALVCGASKGIGHAAAVALARRGARLTVLARSSTRLTDLLPTLIEAGAEEAQALPADYDDREALAEAVGGLLAERGPVHVLIHNSGGPPGGALLEASEEEFLRAFGRTVLVGNLLVSLLLPGMHAAGYGRIISVLSTSVKEPIARLGVGNTVRAAMGGWAKTLSDELPPGVTINNVLPGFTATERLSELATARARAAGTTPESVEEAWISSVPEGRLADPSELGEVIAFLASPAASFVRGVSLAVDGGRMRSI